jgi:hypothetical protein
MQWTVAEISWSSDARRFRYFISDLGTSAVADVPSDRCHSIDPDVWFAFKIITEPMEHARPGIQLRGGITYIVPDQHEPASSLQGGVDQRSYLRKRHIVERDARDLREVATPGKVVALRPIAATYSEMAGYERYVASHLNTPADESLATAVSEGRRRYTEKFLQAGAGLEKFEFHPVKRVIFQHGILRLPCKISAAGMIYSVVADFVPSIYSPPPEVEPGFNSGG